MSITTAFNIAKTGLQLQELNISVKAQNLAAQGVDSYKRQYVVAKDLPYTNSEQEPGAATSAAGTSFTVGLPIGLGVKAAGIYRSSQMGDLISTGQEKDIAIQGEGFYQIEMPDGRTAYSRVATFQLGPDGVLRTISGFPLTPQITIPQEARSLSVSPDGVVQVQLPGDNNFQQIGQIQLATFVNNNGLRAMGDNLFEETEASGTADIGNPGTNQRGMLMQGFREASNVNPVEEITDLIKIQHSYEHLTKVLTTGDAMMEASNRI